MNEEMVLSIAVGYALGRAICKAVAWAIRFHRYLRKQSPRNAAKHAAWDTGILPSRLL